MKFQLQTVNFLQTEDGNYICVDGIWFAISMSKASFEAVTNIRNIERHLRQGELTKDARQESTGPSNAGATEEPKQPVRIRTITEKVELFRKSTNTIRFDKKMRNVCLSCGGATALLQDDGRTYACKQCDMSWKAFDCAYCSMPIDTRDIKIAVCPKCGESLCPNCGICSHCAPAPKQYTNYCWKCGGNIDSFAPGTEQCPKCHWWICPSCGACGCGYERESE